MRRSIAALGCLAMALVGCGQGVSGHTYTCDTGHRLTLQFEFKRSGKLVEARMLAGGWVRNEYDYQEDGENVTYGTGYRAMHRGDELVVQSPSGPLYCHKQ